jgi:hypothetical protein
MEEKKMYGRARLGLARAISEGRIPDSVIDQGGGAAMDYFLDDCRQRTKKQEQERMQSIRDFYAEGGSWESLRKTYDRFAYYLQQFRKGELSEEGFRESAKEYKEQIKRFEADPRYRASVDDIVAALSVK